MSQLYIKCIDIGGYDRILTLNKVYSINDENEQCYFIKDERGVEIGFYKWRFELIDWNNKFISIVNK